MAFMPSGTDKLRNGVEKAPSYERAGTRWGGPPLKEWNLNMPSVVVDQRKSDEGRKSQSQGVDLGV